MGLCISSTGVVCFPPASSSFAICSASECASMPFAVCFSLSGRSGMLSLQRPDRLPDAIFSLLTPTWNDSLPRTLCVRGRCCSLSKLNRRFNDKPLLCLYGRDTTTEQITRAGLVGGTAAEKGRRSQTACYSPHRSYVDWGVRTERSCTRANTSNIPRTASVSAD